MKNTIKKVLSAFAVVVLPAFVLSLSACGKHESNAETKSLYAQGLEIVQLMTEMTQYADVYTTSSEMQSVIQNLGAGDYTTPKAVYAISVADENVAVMAELMGLGLDRASEELKSYFMQKVLGSFMVQINARSGADNLAAASICTIEKTFVNENVNENVIYLYTYENAVPAAVTFLVGEDHAISASGVFVVYDEFSCDSADEIKSLFLGIPVEVTEVLPEK
ncbi:MAG: hypothetical protein K2K87_01695 [Lachnospiraceae bacterium]|nr:hypothetical protein [Lachnospiraceae bacterium]